LLIAQITDLHVRPVGRACNRVVVPNQMLEAAVDAILALDRRPDVVLATGDLTDCGLAEEYAELRRITARLPMPLLVIPGNHDRRAEMAAAFADDRYLPRDGGFLHYVVEDWPVRLIGLDTVEPGYGHGAFCAARRAWLADRLAEGGARPTILFMHHPPFATGLAAMDAINCRDGDLMAPIIARHPNIERVLCGHHHRPIQTRWAGTIGSVAPSTAHQVALAMAPDARATIRLEPPAFHLHLWTPAAGVVTHTALVQSFPGPFPFIAEPEYPGAKKPV
jgi:3',5'-cyclic AMP phosphodiesterase CpdA